MTLAGIKPAYFRIVAQHLNHCATAVPIYIYNLRSLKFTLKRNIILNSICEHNHFVTQGNYKATCFDYRLVIFRPILSIVSQDAMHNLGSHRVHSIL